MKKVLLVILILIIAAAGYYFLRPLFVDDVVNEELPVALQELSLEEFDKAFTLPTESEIAEMTDEEKKSAEMELMTQAEKMQVTVEEEMQELNVENYPQIVSTGNFRDADSFHQGSGQAKIIQLSEDQAIARLENFSVTNGPDLFVYLTKHPNPQGSSDVQQGFVNLGRLKGNKGNQNYEIPSDIDLSEFNSIIIYCKAFSVLFSPAPLS